MMRSAVVALDPLVKKLTNEKASCGRNKIITALVFVGVSTWSWLRGVDFAQVQAEHLGMMGCLVLVLYFEGREHALTTALDLLGAIQDQAYRLPEPSDR